MKIGEKTLTDNSKSYKSFDFPQQNLHYKAFIRNNKTATGSYKALSDFNKTSTGLNKTLTVANKNLDCSQ